MQMKVGIVAISGSFSGGIRLHNLQPTSQYEMTVNGSGAPGLSDSIRAGQNSATIDQNGVQISTGGKMYQGEYFKNPLSVSTDANGNETDRNPINLLGGGDMRGLVFTVNGNCEGTCLASGTLRDPLDHYPWSPTAERLESRDTFFRSPGDWTLPLLGRSLDELVFHPDSIQFRFGSGPSVHISLSRHPESQSTVPLFHVDTDVPGIRHAACAFFKIGCN